MKIANFKAIWDYRYFVLTSVRSDFRNRVSRSRLGFLWLIIAPLSQVLIYAFVLSALMSQRLPGISSSYSYAIYLMAGFQGWFLFLDIFNRTLTVFIDNSNIIKKIYFPRSALPFIIVITSVISNFIFLIIVILVYTAIGFNVGINIFWLPLIMFINVLFSTAFGLICGILNVFIRDVGQIIGIFMQFLFWLTPIVYTIGILPPLFQSIIMLNPLYWLIDSYHQVMAFNNSPNLVALAILFLISLFFLGVAFWLFKKSVSEMVDVL
ncbi:MAG: ABC transporter permease [Hoeflea sp.]|nr:ABC transporter permease [Hoeflea sp.]